MTNERPAILVVDDAPANLVAVDALLSGMGPEIVLVSSGNEALRQLLKRQFLLLLLDVQMPGMDGYEVAEHVRQNPSTSSVPIIFLTANNDTEENVLRGYGSGAVDFLFKPITPEILRGKVRVFLELYESRKQIADAKAVLEAKNVALSQAYAELTAAQSQLVQTAKMASLGELVAGVAHEINNPLAFVTSHLGTVQRSLAEVEGSARGGQLGDDPAWNKAKNRLGEMAMGLGRISDLVVKLRTFSRLDEGERKIVDLRECVESVLTILHHRLGQRIVVELDLEEPLRFECYPSLLNQALLNLVGNAIDAIENEGTVRIESRCIDAELRLVVQDTGTGIPDHLLERVLEPFFTTKEVGQGTGLGLSISYSIAKKHGGTLRLTSSPSGGTAAILSFPLDLEGGNPACPA